MQMLDSPERVFTLPSGQNTTIDHADIRRALLEEQAIEPTDSEKLIYIRDCFDTLFYFFAIIDHYITSTLVCEDDVAYPLEYYVPLLASLHKEVVQYLERYRLRRALKFLSRYPEWRDAR
jgi:hypothetical protein